MKRIAILSLLALICALTSCVPSLHPFHAKDDVVFDAKLVGAWSQADSNDSWSFTKAGPTSYTLVYTDKEGKAGTFKALLFKLGEQLFLDLYPDDDTLKKANAPALYAFHLQPMHTLAKVDGTGPTLVMGFMHPQWIEDKLKESPGALRHEKVNNRILLTAPTKDLQAFILKHANEGMFGEPMILERE